MVKIVYKNNNLEEVNLTSSKITMLAGTNLNDYEWQWNTKNIVTPCVNDFYMSMVEKKATLVLKASSAEEYDSLTSQLLQVFEKDIYNATAGKLWINDSYFLPCYIVAQTFAAFNPLRKVQAVELKIISETGRWIKAVNNYFGILSGETQTGNLEYSYDYEYDYMGEQNITEVINSHFVPCDFEMTIFGAVMNPAVVIGENEYQVSVDLLAGEYLKINTKEKTIYAYKQDGTRVNCFDLRSRERSDFFAPINSGKNAVVWDNSFNFNIEMYIERSAPVWI